MLKPGAALIDGLDLDAIFAEVADHSAFGLAVSGGPDSLALMLLVRAWCDQRAGAAPAVTVYCVDHRLRPEAMAEAAFVARTAQQLGFSSRTLVWTGDKPSTGIQVAARQARYRLIGAAMAKDKVPTLLTGHHVEDQAETVLMRMAHGSGIKGLGGMAAWSTIEGVLVHRPLLGIDRPTLQKIVNRSGLTPADDPSNRDGHYERVRWRQFAPALAGHGLTSDGLSRLALRMQRADAALDAAAEAACTAHVSMDNFGVAEIERAGFAALEPEIANRVLSRMFGRIGRAAPRLEQLEALHLALGDSAFSGTCLAGADVRYHVDKLVLFAETGRMDLTPLNISPQNAGIWDQRFEIANHSATPITVTASTDITRDQATQFTGTPVSQIMAAVAASPSVTDASGTHIALGLFTRSQDVSVTLCR